MKTVQMENAARRQSRSRRPFSEEEPRLMKGNRRFAAGLVIILAIILFDQLVKLWASTVLREAPGQLLPFIPGFMDLRYMQNTGAAFSLFSESTWILGTISAALAAVIVYFLWRGRSRPLLYTVALSFIAGGAIGNVIDRFRLGYVVDMLEFEFVRFAVFNVADSFVCVGAVLFAVYIIMSADRPEKVEARRE